MKHLFIERPEFKGNLPERKMEEHEIQDKTSTLEQNKKIFVKWPTRSRSESESIYTPNTPIYLRSSSTPIYAGPAARIIQDRMITDLEDKILRLDRQIPILEDLENQAGHSRPKIFKNSRPKKS